LIKEIYIDNRAEWNAIVRSFIDYDVYYLAEYVEAFELHGDGIPTLFVCLICHAAKLIKSKEFFVFPRSCLPKYDRTT
jgi:hypothetical protein